MSAGGQGRGDPEVGCNGRCCMKMKADYELEDGCRVVGLRRLYAWYHIGEGDCCPAVGGCSFVAGFQDGTKRVEKVCAHRVQLLGSEALF